MKKAGTLKLQTKKPVAATAKPVVKKPAAKLIAKKSGISVTIDSGADDSDIINSSDEEHLTVPAKNSALIKKKTLTPVPATTKKAPVADKKVVSASKPLFQSLANMDDFEDESEEFTGEDDFDFGGDDDDDDDDWDSDINMDDEEEIPLPPKKTVSPAINVPAKSSAKAIKTPEIKEEPYISKPAVKGNKNTAKTQEIKEEPVDLPITMTSKPNVNDDPVHIKSNPKKRKEMVKQEIKDEIDDEIITKPRKLIKKEVKTNSSDEEDDAGNEEEEEEIYDWKLDNEEELAQKRSKEIASDLLFERLCEQNKKVEAQRKAVIQERQQEAKEKRKIKRYNPTLMTKLAIKQNYIPHMW